MYEVEHQKKVVQNPKVYILLFFEDLYNEQVKWNFILSDERNVKPSLLGFLIFF